MKTELKTNCSPVCQAFKKKVSTALYPKRLKLLTKFQNLELVLSIRYKLTYICTKLLLNCHTNWLNTSFNQDVFNRPGVASCQVSGVRCQVSLFYWYYYFFSLFYEVSKLVGGGSVINGAYPSSLFFTTFSYAKRLLASSNQFQSGCNVMQKNAKINILKDSSF